MIWYKNLYSIDNSDAKRIIKAIKKKQPIVGTYVLTLPSNCSNLLDLYEAVEIFNPFFDNKDLIIVGVAPDKEAAMLLSGKIVDEVYKETGGFDVSKYLGFR